MTVQHKTEDVIVASEMTDKQTILPERASWVARAQQAVRQHFAENMVPYLLLVMLLLFIVVALAPRIFISIQPGHLGVLYSRFGGGTVTTKVYPEGLHLIAPWDSLTSYDVRVQQEPMTITVLSREALPMKLAISIRYYPEKSILGFLHSDVGPNYKNKIVIPEVVSVIRTIAGQYSAEELYSSQLPFEQAVNQSLEQIARKYVVLDGVDVKSIELPKSVQQAIEEKLQEQQLAAAYQYKIQCAILEAKRKRIEAEGIRQYNKTIQSSLSPDVLKWNGIQATKELAQSKNAKVVIIGNGSKQMPIVLGGD